MDIIQKLTEQFKRFPGIGPRQAKRFAYHLFQQDQDTRLNLVNTILSIQNTVRTCDRCFKFFPARNGDHMCQTCSDPSRDAKLLMVVSHDIDCENVEKSQSFNGYYFILGGTLPILEKAPEEKIRINQLKKRVESGTLSEIILALNPTPDGEHTQEFLIEALQPLKASKKFTISTLGRGLSTGLELEYSDAETIKNSLKNRSKF